MEVRRGTSWGLLERPWPHNIYGCSALCKYMVRPCSRPLGLNGAYSAVRSRYSYWYAAVVKIPTLQRYGNLQVRAIKKYLLQTDLEKSRSAIRIDGYYALNKSQWCTSKPGYPADGNQFFMTIVPSGLTI